MHIAMIGLGRMGSNMARRLLAGGHEVVAFDLSPEARESLAAEGAVAAASLAEVAELLPAPRTAWVMVPSGAATEAVLDGLAEHFEPGDLLVDGGNSWFQDDLRRAAGLRERGLEFMDVGTSGGVWGLERGYCLMAGGSPAAFERLRPALATLAPGRGDVPPADGREGRESTAEEGYLHCGPVGSGHFVKMIHNGIEYGLMQAYAEGFEILRRAGDEGLPEERRFDIDVRDVAELWRRGSVVGSWLLDLTAAALARDPGLEEFSGHVNDSGEGRWTVMAAIEQACEADVLSAALYRRFRSRKDSTFGEKVLSAMRKGFGGHVETKADR